MQLSCLLLCLCFSTLAAASGGSNWCYHGYGCETLCCNWTLISGAFCGGIRQSPINIDTSQLVNDPKLQNFKLDGFSSRHVFKSLTNTGHTGPQVAVSGGGLKGSYSAVQFHFHWGAVEDPALYHPGSEHTVNHNRYHMEMHIVSLKTGLTVAQALALPAGIAVLGFFINAEGPNTQPWTDFTNYLQSIKSKDTAVNIQDNQISLNDLIGDVDLTKFYRYNGSLTTPTCNEAVVWTIFKEPIKVSLALIKLFPVQTELYNVYRPTQLLNGRLVSGSPAIFATD